MTTTTRSVRTEPITMAHVDRRLTLLKYTEQSGDRNVVKPVISEVSDWQWGDQTCEHVTKMVQAWHTTVPNPRTGERNPMVAAWFVRLCCARRAGCITQADYDHAKQVATHRLEWLLENTGRYRKLRVNEIAHLEALGEQRASEKTDDECLKEAHSHVDADRMAAFIAEHTKATRPNLLAVLVSALHKSMDAGKSCEQALPGVLISAMKEAAIGYYPAQTAVTTLRSVFTESGEGTHEQWDRLLIWAVGQALAADLDKHRARIDEKVPDNFWWIREPPHDSELSRRRDNCPASGANQDTAPQSNPIVDRFNVGTSWAQILMPHGWACRGRDPDADGTVWLHPTAATTRGSAKIRAGRLHVHAPGTGLPITPAGLSKFDVYTILAHDGDQAAASRTVAAGSAQ